MRHSPLYLLAFSLLLLATPHILRAQDVQRSGLVRGWVVDQMTSQPLPGTLVELPEPGRRAITDADGRFVIADLEPGTYRVQVSQLGYQEHTDSWVIESGLLNLTIALGPRPVTLPGVTANGYTVGASIRERRLRSPIASQAIDRRELSVTGARTGLEAVLASGFLMHARCGMGPEVCVMARGRWVSPEVYIDDRRGLLQELETLRPNDLYAVEVYRGGRHIRAYTVWWVESEGQRASRRPLRPLEIW